MDSSQTAGHTFRAKVDVVEWLGNESYAYIPFEAPEEVQAQLTQLEKDLDGESMRTQLVISLDGSSKVAEGDDAEIYVNSDHMHLFDPATGENLTLDSTSAGQVPSGDAMAQAEQAGQAQDEVAGDRVAGDEQPATEA
jgi:multiple sugar transport system ATP-binding protein